MSVCLQGVLWWYSYKYTLHTTKGTVNILILRSYELEETYSSWTQYSLWEGGVIYRCLTETEDVRKWLLFTNYYNEIRLDNAVCPARYRTRHFFNNFTTNEDIATKLEADYRHIPLHFSHNERTPVRISLQYLHWCYNY